MTVVVDSTDILVESLIRGDSNEVTPLGEPESVEVVKSRGVDESATLVLLLLELDTSELLVVVVEDEPLGVEDMLELELVAVILLTKDELLDSESRLVVVVVLVALSVSLDTPEVLLKLELLVLVGVVVSVKLLELLAELGEEKLVVDEEIKLSPVLVKVELLGSLEELLLEPLEKSELLDVSELLVVLAKLEVLVRLLLVELAEGLVVLELLNILLILVGLS